MVLVFGPFAGSPITSVGVDKLGGVDGTFHVILVNGVVVVPVAITVGLKQVNVCVNMLAETFGATVFWITGTESMVRHQFELS